MKTKYSKDYMSGTNVGKRSYYIWLISIVFLLLFLGLLVTIRLGIANCWWPSERCEAQSRDEYCRSFSLEEAPISCR